MENIFNNMKNLADTFIADAEEFVRKQKVDKVVSRVDLGELYDNKCAVIYSDMLGELDVTVDLHEIGNNFHLTIDVCGQPDLVGEEYEYTEDGLDVLREALTAIVSELSNIVINEISNNTTTI